MCNKHNMDMMILEGHCEFDCIVIRPSRTHTVVMDLFVAVLLSGRFHEHSQR